MPNYTAELRALTPAQKLELVEMIWDDLGECDASIPLPDWVAVEAARRRDEMTSDATLGLSHDEVWRRIERRNG